MTTVVAEFDGKVFVPQQPVCLPTGTLITISIPADRDGPMGAAIFTDEEDQDWERMLTHIRSGEPEFSSVEEAMRHIRMRP